MDRSAPLWAPLWRWLSSPSATPVAAIISRSALGVVHRRLRGNICRKTMVSAFAAAITLPAAAQSFVNLDFEQAKVPALPPTGTLLLPWDLAAPGWMHSAGDSTDTVAYLNGHVGFSQTYVLRDGTQMFGPQGGAFSMSFRGGTLHEQEPRGDWVHAFIAQRGTIPQGTGELRLLSTSFQFQVLIDGVPITMQPIGLDPTMRDSPFARALYSGPWAGDVSSFAGQVVDLRIVDTFPVGQYSGLLAVDNISFLPVPEPSTAWVLAFGMVVLLIRRRSERPAPQEDAA